MKKSKNNYNTQVVNRLSQKHKVTTRFVQMALKGDRTSERSVQIQREYKYMVKELAKTLRSL